jgi:hypothetical protein
VSLLLVGLAAFLAACSSSTAGNSGGSGGNIAKTKAEVIAAWRAAETAFYTAGSQSNGAGDPALEATMVDPELTLVRRNFSASQREGLIGQGSWNLGSPSVVSLRPSQGSPQSATVKSCIDDAAILVNRRTRQPVPGIGGTPDWIGATSEMVLTHSGWKLSQQSAVVNTMRAIACAGV